MNRVNAEERKKFVEEFSSSGKSQSEFCREHGISEQTFSGWLKHDRRVPGKFVPLETGKSQTAVEVTFGDGTTVRIVGQV